MAIDWTKIYQKHKGLWVALKNDEVTVISAGKTLKEVSKKAKNKGFDNPIFFRVPAKIIPYIGAF